MVDAASKPKVFGLGLSRTGTKTLDVALTSLGYRVRGYDGELLRACKGGDTAALFDTIDRYDAFEDWPFPLAYREIIDRLGASARYVLTVRRSTEVWIESQIAHAERRHRLEPTTRELVFGYPQPRGREAEHALFYEQHNKSVRELIAERNLESCFTEVCWELGDGWPELCALLGRAPPDLPFPHTNKRKVSPEQAAKTSQAAPR